MKVKVADYIAQFLVKAGVQRVFTVTGGGAMHLNDALGHQQGLRCLYQHHEQACAMAAECYSRLHEGKLAVLCVTTGPGGTNAITGVVGGWLDSIPMLVLSGQVRYDTTARSTGLQLRAMGDQEFDITKAVDCMTKYSEMILDPKRIRYCLEKALYLAYAGRPGPCWLDIPLNVQGAYVESESLVGFDAVSYEEGGDGWAGEENMALPDSDALKLSAGTGVTLDAMHRSNGAAIPEDFYGVGEPRYELPEPVSLETAQKILKKIREGKRPVLNAGNGIRIAGCHELFLEVVNRLGIPVVTGWNSIDCMYDTHPLYVGRAGGMGDRAGNFAVQNSDVLLSLASRLSIRQVGYNWPTWAKGAYVIANDIDEEELKKPSLHVEFPVHADVRSLLSALLEALKLEEVLAYKEEETEEGCVCTHCGEWVRICQNWKHRYPVVLPQHFAAGDEKEANVYAFIKTLSDALPKGQVTVVGNGSACVVGGHAYVIKEGQRFISNSAIASMGYDLPAAIGAWTALQDNPQGSSSEAAEDSVILVTGDGSIQMNLQELQTIIHHRMNIKIFLINNGGYHSIRQTQKNFFGEPLVGIGVDSHDLSFPQMDKLAAAYGYPYICAKHNGELKKAVEETLKTEGPVICEVFVDKKQVFEPKSSAKRLQDGTMVSPPLEDLSPFLPEEEMAEIMSVSGQDRNKE
ncbi:MAG: thiamine pyrophosphate-binding protein [bacterium]|nr:thiamine pyrophosphate-binding protein [bacterium]